MKYWFVVLCSMIVFCINAQTASPNQISKAAVELTYQQVRYDPSYFSIPYPNGDVPANRGVCTDVVIRAYRKLNIDLQKKKCMKTWLRILVCILKFGDLPKRIRT